MIWLIAAVVAWIGYLLFMLHMTKNLPPKR